METRRLISSRAPPTKYTIPHSSYRKTITAAHVLPAECLRRLYLLLLYFDAWQSDPKIVPYALQKPGIPSIKKIPTIEINIKHRIALDNNLTHERRIH